MPPHVGSYTYRDPRFGGAASQGYDFTVAPLRGGGILQLGIFIQAPSVCPSNFPVVGCLSGDSRGFDPNAPTGESKAFIWINLDTGDGTVVLSPSCQANRQHCVSAFPITFGSRNNGSAENDFGIISTASDGHERIVIGTSFHEAEYQFPIVPGINDLFDLNVTDSGTVHGIVAGPDFPSVEIYHRTTGHAGDISTAYLGQEGPSIGFTRLFGYWPRFDRF